MVSDSRVRLSRRSSIIKQARCSFCKRLIRFEYGYIEVLEYGRYGVIVDRLVCHKRCARNKLSSMSGDSRLLIEDVIKELPSRA